MPPFQCLRTLSPPPTHSYFHHFSVAYKTTLPHSHYPPPFFCYHHHHHHYHHHYHQHQNDYHYNGPITTTTRVLYSRRHYTSQTVSSQLRVGCVDRMTDTPFPVDNLPPPQSLSLSSIHPQLSTPPPVIIPPLPLPSTSHQPDLKCSWTHCLEVHPYLSTLAKKVNPNHHQL